MLGGSAAATETVEEQQAARPQQRERPEQPQFERQDSIDAFALAGGATQEKLKDPKVIAGLVVALLLLRWLFGRRG
jgi:hypothetical protein